MAFSSAQRARLILGDFTLSAFLTKIEPDLAIPMLDTTVLTSTSEECIPGVMSGKVAMSGLLDSDGSATGQNQQIFAQLGATADDAVSYAPTGFALGNPTISLLAVEDSYAVHDDVKSAISWDMSVVADGGIEYGISLADLAAITVDTNGTGVDNAALTSNGGAAFIHVTAFSGLTNDIVKVQHSTDNSSWADLATFTTVTAKTSQRVVVAAGTTVNRYLRAIDDVTGSGSITRAVTFARR